MNDAVKCMEDFDLFNVSSANLNGAQKFPANGNADDDTAGICSIED